MIVYSVYSVSMFSVPMRVYSVYSVSMFSMFSVPMRVYSVSLWVYSVGVLSFADSSFTQNSHSLESPISNGSLDLWNTQALTGERRIEKATQSGSSLHVTLPNVRAESSSI